MGCDCLGYDGWEGEGNTSIIRNKVVTARKPRTCGGCGTEIMKGDRCRVIGGTFDGEFWSFSYHEACHDLLIGAANHFMTGWFYDCEFMDCLDGWLEEFEELPEGEKRTRLIGLCGQVIEISNREGATDGQN